MGMPGGRHRPPLACDATIIPIVLGAASEHLDIGRASGI